MQSMLHFTSHNLNIEIEVMDSFFSFLFWGHKNLVFVCVFQCLCFMLSTLTSSVKGSLDL